MRIIDQLCELLLIDVDELIQFSKRAPKRYKIYSIAKRSGKGTRTIAHPSKELKFIQRAIVKVLKVHLPIHNSAMAYKNNVSVRDNALKHCNNRYLLKMDFRDFFPSINPELFFDKLEGTSIQLDEQEKNLLTRLLFLRKRYSDSYTLSIGAPSSPLISNFIMNEFDSHIFNFCIENRIVYTRYADDLTFSTNVKNLLFTMPSKVQQLLDEHNYNAIMVNADKTIFSSMAHNRHVTGVTITNEGRLSVGRKRKREISSLIHKYSNEALDTNAKERLQGIFSFACFIEPEFRKRMVLKYGEKLIYKLTHNTPEDNT